MLFTLACAVMLNENTYNTILMNATSSVTCFKSSCELSSRSRHSYTWSACNRVDFVNSIYDYTSCAGFYFLPLQALVNTERCCLTLFVVSQGLPAYLGSFVTLRLVFISLSRALFLKFLKSISFVSDSTDLSRELPRIAEYFNVQLQLWGSLVCV